MFGDIASTSMFDIDLISFSFAVLLIAAFVLPFYVHARKIKLSERNAFSVRNSYTASQGLHLHDQDSWRNQYFIGIDRERAVVVYSSDVQAGTYSCIHLQEVRRASVSEVSHQVADGKKSRKELDRLDLKLIDYQDRIAYTLEFYDGERYSDLVGEAVLIKKWEELVKASVNQVSKAQLVG